MGKFRRAYSRRNVNLLLYQWIALDRIAHETKSICTRGTRRGNRSWRCLLRRIAEGELIVTEPGPVNLKPVARENVTPVAQNGDGKISHNGVKRKVGRPIPNREPIPAPPDWFYAEKSELTATNGSAKNGE